MKLGWLTDLHLNKERPSSRERFYRKISRDPCDAFVLTGDISNSKHVSHHLTALANACGSRKLYFVLGNHDFYGSCFREVDRLITEICHHHPNITHLGHGGLQRLGGCVALVGHRGWADGRAGRFNNVSNPDWRSIKDFRCLRGKGIFDRMEALGKSSAAYFRRVLPYALTHYQHVFVATHVPPFVEAAHFNGKQCDGRRIPHYTNVSAGCVIRGIGKYFPQRKITVLCGHTHRGAQVRIAENIEVLAGEAGPNRLNIQRIFDL